VAGSGTAQQDFWVAQYQSINIVVIHDSFEKCNVLFKVDSLVESPRLLSLGPLELLSLAEHWL